MAYDHKPGTFSLYKNDKKKTDNHPDYTGYGKDASGADIEVAAWIKSGTKGKFMSCSFKLKPSGQQTPRPAPKPADDDLDTPF